MNRPAAATRTLILEVAATLFYKHGIRSVGVDRIAAEAGVAPTTLYRAFSSKDTLVTAYLERGDEMAKARAAQVEIPSDPGSRILQEFTFLVRSMDESTYRGCPCQMTLAEFPDPDSPVHKRAQRVKTELMARFQELAIDYCGDQNHDAAKSLGEQLFVLHEGLMASAMSGDPHRLAGPTLTLVERALEVARPPGGTTDGPV